MIWHIKWLCIHVIFAIRVPENKRYWTMDAICINKCRDIWLMCNKYITIHAVLWQQSLVLHLWSVQMCVIALTSLNLCYLPWSMVMSNVLAPLLFLLYRVQFGIRSFVIMAYLLYSTPGNQMLGHFKIYCVCQELQVNINFFRSDKAQLFYPLFVFFVFSCRCPPPLSLFLSFSPLCFFFILLTLSLVFKNPR